MPSRVTPAPVRSLRQPALGAAYTVLESATRGAGERTLLAVDLCAAGGTSPQRYLARDARYEAVAGRLTLWVEGVAHVLEPGESLVVPAGAARRLANDTLGGVRLRLDLTPGHEGFERALRAWCALAADGLVARDGSPLSPYHLAVLLDWSQTRPAALSADAETPLALLLRAAHARGVDAALAERYAL